LRLALKILTCIAHCLGGVQLDSHATAAGLVSAPINVATFHYSAQAVGCIHKGQQSRMKKRMEIRVCEE
jgi:hypothetical protein